VANAQAGGRERGAMKKNIVKRWGRTSKIGDRGENPSRVCDGGSKSGIPKKGARYVRVRRGNDAKKELDKKERASFAGHTRRGRGRRLRQGQSP